ncbi:MAG: hypothetical protein LJE59_15655 [Chromatiaceae bacterium]|nr:hypothetical protein [Chromatiaceae bacterium]
MHPGIPALATLLILAATAGADDKAGLYACPDAASLSVATGDADDLALVCDGGASALTFLSGLGLSVPAALSIEVVHSLPPLYGASQIGSYDARADRIQVLAYACCAAMGTREDVLFGQPVSPDLYRSIVAHEVAHALVTANYSGETPSIVAQEYIAYTTQFVAMSPELRERILAASRISAFAGEQQMSAMLYFIDPQAFGVAAYRHFAAQRDGRLIVWRLLRGEARLARPPE